MAIETMHGRSLPLRIFGGVAIAFLIFPSFIVAMMSVSDSAYLRFPPTGFSLRWYEAVWNSPIWISSSLNSLKIGLASAALSTAIGVAVALGFKLKGRVMTGAQMAFLSMPLMVPGIVLGIAIYVVYAPFGLNGSFSGLVLAHTMLAMPFVILTMAAALRHFDVNQFNAAMSLGAGPFRAFTTVVVPQIAGAVVASLLFAFLTSFDEIVVTNFIGGGEYTTLPQRMFNSLRQDLDPKIAAIGTTLTLLTILVLVCVVLLQGKKGIVEMLSNGKDDEH
ncbi:MULTISPECIES: ABC transporter permease [Mesorhizobium]|uniref:ABC transporter permease n=1 Tax=Mesorhizobium TaxID=68287 RepID=UPI0010A970BE|nr:MULTISPECIES: ABC transporter permease [Mesorhizobium]